MTTAAKHPSTRNPASFHLRRWEELRGDPLLQTLPGRVETNGYGQILMTPPPGFSHSSRQFEIGFHLKTLMPGGSTLVECAVLTSDGVKAAGVAWISARRVKRGLKRELLTIAPEICVEVVSPGNSQPVMDHKRQLYFEAGADEVWFCDANGTLRFFLRGAPENTAKSSHLCPAMPKSLGM